jgi:hypothetical protein
VRGVEDGDAGGQGGRHRRLQQRGLDTHAAQADPQLFLAQPDGHPPMVGDRRPVLRPGQGGEVATPGTAAR